MIVLACETSTLLGSAAVVENSVCAGLAESMRQGSHSDVLNLYIEQSLQQANVQLDQVNVFATGVGPGSFTGIRICLNTIKTLAYCFQKPIITMNSLHNLAYGAQHSKNWSQLKKMPVISMINAYKNMVYVSSFQEQNGLLVEQKPAQVVRVQNLEGFIDSESLICGDGFTTYEKYFSADLKKKLIRDDSVSDEASAKNLALYASEIAQQTSLLRSWGETLPLYLRQSEAEENQQGIKYQPLF